MANRGKLANQKFSINIIRSIRARSPQLVGALVNTTPASSCPTMPSRCSFNLQLLHLHHHGIYIFEQMSSFVAESPPVVLGDNIEYVDHPTYLLARDEDCENTFHHSADLVR